MITLLFHIAIVTSLISYGFVTRRLLQQVVQLNYEVIRLKGRLDHRSDQ